MGHYAVMHPLSQTVARYKCKLYCMLPLRLLCNLHWNLQRS